MSRATSVPGLGPCRTSSASGGTGGSGRRAQIPHRACGARPAWRQVSADGLLGNIVGQAGAKLVLDVEEPLQLGKKKLLIQSPFL